MRTSREGGPSGRQLNLVARADVGGDTFGKLLVENARIRGSRPAMRFKDNGIWVSWTWAEVNAEARGLAAGLQALGLKRGDKIAIVGSTGP
jgi:long-chain acyl-CoA synthetase